MEYTCRLAVSFAFGRLSVAAIHQRKAAGVWIQESHWARVTLACRECSSLVCEATAASAAVRTPGSFESQLSCGATPVAGLNSGLDACVVWLTVLQRITG